MDGGKKGTRAERRVLRMTRKRRGSNGTREGEVGRRAELGAVVGAVLRLALVLKPHLHTPDVE